MLQLIELAYAAALQPAEWPTFLEGVAKATHCQSAAMLVQDLSGENAQMPWFFGMPELAAAEYETWAPRNVVMQAAAPSMRTGVVFKSVPISKRDMMRSEYYQEYLRRIPDAVPLAGACIFFEEPIMALLSLQGRIDNPGCDGNDLAVVRALVPHLQRAVSIQRRVGMMEIQHAAMSDVFDRLGSAVFVLDERGQVIVYNSTAARTLKAADGLSLSAAGEMRAEEPHDDGRLRGLIGDAARTGAGRGLGAGGALRVRRPSGRHPYAVIVAPLVLPHLVLVAQRPAAVMFVTDLERAGPPVAGLRALFNLTPAEAKVAELLARGERAADISDQLQLALPTVRTHIRRLLDKTGARGQPDLVRMLVTSLAGVVNTAAAAGAGHRVVRSPARSLLSPTVTA